MSIHYSIDLDKHMEFKPEAAADEIDRLTGELHAAFQRERAIIEGLAEGAEYDAAEAKATIDELIKNLLQVTPKWREIVESACEEKLNDLLTTPAYEHVKKIYL